jgi:methyl-accepting chemotaxis protein
MTDNSPSQGANQFAACQRLVWAASALVPVVAVLSWAVGNGLIVAPLVALAFAGAGWAVIRSPELAQIGAAIAVVGQPIALTAAMSGQPWQIDMHMSFFAFLACLVMLMDLHAILIGAAIVVVHHLSLSLLMPALIYPSGTLSGNVVRTLIHGAMVALEASALVVTVQGRLRANLERDAKEAAVAAAQAKVAQALATAEADRAKADENSRKADALRAEAEAAQARTLAETRRSEQLSAQAREREGAERARQAAAAEQQHHVVHALSEALGRLAEGDLSVSLTTHFAEDYEGLRRDFNVAAERLAGAIAEVAAVSGQIRSEAGAINNAAGELSVRTERQAATLEQTSAAMTEFTSSVKQSAQMATDAESSTARARNEAIGSGTIVSKAVQSMQRIAESSQKIARINSVIDEIAFQTNLLALNAGVEAARAGESGRGFAVVASEVRALAQRCSDAAKEITALIQESGIQVKEGVDLVGQTGAALSTITESVTAAAEQVASIARTATSQAQSLGEMNAAIADLDRVTQQNASMFEETTATCQSLDSATLGMIDLVARFRTGREGRGQQADFRSRRRA